jgi:hypothetical protein
MASKGAESLTRGLLELNARRRLTAEEALTHPWLTGDKNGCVSCYLIVVVVVVVVVVMFSIIIIIIMVVVVVILFVRVIIDRPFCSEDPRERRKRAPLDYDPNGLTMAKPKQKVRLFTTLFCCCV